MHGKHFSDEELVAYLDGEAEFAPVAAIEAALLKDADLQARLSALSVDRAALEEAFAGLVPDRVLVPAAPAKTASRGLWMSLSGAAVAASLVLGIFIGSARTTPLADWAEYVAAYQALYSTSTLSHLQATPDAQQAELDRVSAAIGKNISVGALTLFPSVQYARSQILSYQGRPLIQLAFLTSTGEPVALCIIRAEEGAATASGPRMVEMEGLSTALWEQDGYRYILIGGRDDDLISRMAAAFHGTNV